MLSLLTFVLIFIPASLQWDLTCVHNRGVTDPENPWCFTYYVLCNVGSCSLGNVQEGDGGEVSQKRTVLCLTPGCKNYLIHLQSEYKGAVCCCKGKDLCNDATVFPNMDPKKYLYDHNYPTCLSDTKWDAKLSDYATENKKSCLNKADHHYHEWDKWNHPYWCYDKFEDWGSVVKHVHERGCTNDRGRDLCAGDCTETAFGCCAEVDLDYYVCCCKEHYCNAKNNAYKYYLTVSTTTKYAPRTTTTTTKRHRKSTTTSSTTEPTTRTFTEYHSGGLSRVALILIIVGAVIVLTVVVLVPVMYFCPGWRYPFGPRSYWDKKRARLARIQQQNYYGPAPMTPIPTTSVQPKVSGKEFENQETAQKEEESKTQEENESKTGYTYWKK